MSGKIEREKRVVEFMIGLYCRHKLPERVVTGEYRELVNYAHARLDRCRFGESKTSCKRCPVHCYGKKQREMIRKVMRWAGPRMLLYAPLESLRHL